MSHRKFITLTPKHVIQDESRKSHNRVKSEATIDTAYKKKAS
jgi:hypothetical protein